MFAKRMNQLRKWLGKSDLDVALITDDDSVYYYTGYFDYLHMEFGRPTILAVPRETLIRLYCLEHTIFNKFSIE